MPHPERAAKLSAGLAKGFGEDFTFTARKADTDVNNPKVADTSRTQFTATGVFAGGTKERRPPARGYAADHAQGVVASPPRASFEDAALLWTPIEGDLALRVEEEVTYAVARTLPDSFGRTLIYFTAKKR